MGSSSNSKSLVKLKRDWADEFTVEGFRVLDEDQLEKFHEWLSINGGFYFGTNEGFEEGEVKLSDFEITLITEEEAEVLERLLDPSKYGFGQFPYFEGILEDMADEGVPL